MLVGELVVMMESMSVEVMALRWVEMWVVKMVGRRADK